MRKTNFSGRYVHKIDRHVIEIMSYMKYKHLMEIVDYAHKLMAQEDQITSFNMIKKRKK